MLNVGAQDKIFNEMKAFITKDWVRKNPTFQPTKISFFRGPKPDLYIAPLQWSGAGHPFTWDCDLKGLEFLLKRNHPHRILKDHLADKIYGGNKVVWENSIEALVWTKDNIYKSFVTDWYLIKNSDCPGNKIFPTISFSEAFHVKDSITNNLSGLGIIPFDPKITKISSEKNSLKTNEGKSIEGNSFDLNDDKIPDIFIYREEIDETTSYKRLYLNIQGTWVFKWAMLDEECI